MYKPTINKFPWNSCYSETSETNPVSRKITEGLFDHAEIPL